MVNYKPKDKALVCIRTFVRLLNLEEGVATTLRNIVNYKPKDKALVCIRNKSL